ncbi:hypothetical protein [Bradyrhizobium sp.]|uniref:hypothetical protein n=1 Tax=Bradyrhizobium sp. TaxID=376 RepID=UPI002603F157|nr:hypothetical protein [Bradyrhizobium sp.]
MKAKLLASTLLAASLIAAPAVAFAQSEMAKPETKSEMAKPMTTHHSMRSTHMKKGMTTGMSSATRAKPGGRSVTRKPPGS